MILSEECQFKLLQSINNMRQNNQNKQNQQRSRGRSRGKPQNPLTRNYESNGPDVKVRGNAQTIAEKYQQLARDAQSAGDVVLEQSYLQHAEHYLRMIEASRGNQPSQQRPTNESVSKEQQPAPTPEPSTGGNGSEAAVVTNPKQQTNGENLEPFMTESSLVTETKNQDEIASLNSNGESFPTSPPLDTNQTHTPRGRGVRRVAVARDRSETSLNPTAG